MTVPFLLGTVCFQVDVSTVVSFTRYIGHKYGHFFLSLVGYLPEGSVSFPSSAINP